MAPKRRRASRPRRKRGYSRVRRSKKVMMSHGHGEVKAADLEFANVASGTTLALPSIVDVSLNTYACLNILRQGAASSQRIGRKVNMLSLTINGFLYRLASSDAQTLRMLVVYDNQTNGVQPVIQDIIGGLTSSGSPNAVNNTFQLLNLNNKSRFAILYDKQMSVAKAVAQAAASSGVASLGNMIAPQSTPTNISIKKTINLRGAEVTFSANGGTVGDITTGGLYLIFLGAGALGSGNPVAADWGFFGNTRLRFAD